MVFDSEHTSPEAPSLLIVDDDPSLRKLLVRSLSRLGYDTTSASGVAEASRELRIRRFDALVLDWKLRDGDGLDIMRVAREQSEVPHVVFMTGHEAQYIEDVARAMGATAFVPKPLSGRRIAEALEPLLGRIDLAHAETAPSLRPPEPVRRQAGGRPTTGEPGHVVVVDDDPVTVLRAQRLIEGVGHRVTTFLNPREAAAFVADHVVDLVVTDLVMPEMSGFELLEAIHRCDSELAVVLITASPDVPGAVTAMQRGAFRYLPKPLDTTALADALTAGIKATRAGRRRQLLLEGVGTLTPRTADLPSLDTALDTALERLHLIASPVVLAQSTEMIVGYVVDVCSESAHLSSAVTLRTTAERLGRLSQVREAILRTTVALFDDILPQQLLFLRAHPGDLRDAAYGESGPLRGREERAVVMVSARRWERSASERTKWVRSLRDRGAQICLEHVGSQPGPGGAFRSPYVGGATYAYLEPSLVTVAAQFPSQQQALRDFVARIEAGGMQVIAPGITTQAERSIMTEIGCDALAGPLFDAPGRETR